jgi:hypothetical protein
MHTRASGACAQVRTRVTRRHASGARAARTRAQRAYTQAWVSAARARKIQRVGERAPLALVSSVMSDWAPSDSSKVISIRPLRQLLTRSELQDYAFSICLPGIGSASAVRHAGAPKGSAKYCVSCRTFPSANSITEIEYVGMPS